MNYDAIIIGGGISGLSCAASLAAQGKKVIVLEKQSVTGGFIQSFKHKEWQWNVGTHGIASINDNIVRSCLNYLTDNNVAFFKINDALAEIDYLNKKFTIPDDRNKFVESLIEAFPDEKISITRFVKTMEMIDNKMHLQIIPKILPPILSKITHPLFSFSIKKYLNKSLKQMLDLYFKSPLLKNIFSFHSGRMGAPVNTISFCVYSRIFKSYFDGAFYPIGGGDSIVKSISDVICQKNGTILTSTEVKQIIVENNKAKGVVLKDNKSITADTVISSIGIPETINYFSLEKVLKREQKMTYNLKRSFPLITLYVGFQNDLENLNIGLRNYRFLSSLEDSSLRDPNNDNWEPESISIYFSVKGKLSGDKATAQLLVPTDYTFFEKWKNTEIGRRGEEYNNLKIKITKKLTSFLIQKFPGIEEHIAYTNLATPLTVISYTGSLSGSIYRLVQSVPKFNNINLCPKSSLKNLYFTGSDIFAHGIMGSFLSGVITASSICQVNLLSKFSKSQQKSISKLG
jgi:all-trans-retinol 13,14-reductase